jgi:O-antigen ligase
VDAARRSAGGALFWTMTCFLAYSGVSALWSGRWMTISDELRRAFWIEYLLLIFCYIGSGSVPLLRRAMEFVLLFAAAAALLTVVVFFAYCEDCGRFAGFGAHAKATRTAMIIGAIGLIGLSATFCRTSARAALLLACQAPLCALISATGSRGALPSYLACVLLSATLMARCAGGRRARLAIGTALGCVIVAAAAISALGRGWLDEQLRRGDSMRLELWAVNLKRIAERPWFGHGATAWDIILLPNGEIGTHAHNLFLAQGFYVGLVGLALWVAVFALSLRVGVRVFRARRELLPLVPILFLLMVGCVDIGAVVIDVQPEWLYVWVVLGIALTYDIDLRRRAITSR